ncbi:hypothetical protein FJZ22_01715 [Candidatus Pacearchaeota archaeon]|nr:hypothetical protein [Candidatus Pacearchaeota archaeon]
MINAEKVTEIKSLIMAFVQARGPSLPVHIARDVTIDPLFASAFLSELFREHKLRMSHLKVGSTALYLLPGQEQQLENFTHYLNQREQEAYHLIKKAGLIAHHQLNPIMQVAITHIPDFVQSLEQQGVKYWHYAFLPAEELNTRLNQLTKPTIKESYLEEPEQKKELLPSPSSSLADIKQAIVEQETAFKAIQQKPRKVKQPKQKAPPQSLPTSLSFSPQPEQLKPLLPFTQISKTFLESKHFQSINIQKEEKKECQIQATKETITYTILAKNRKKLQETDLQEAITLLQSNRTPLILIFQAPLDKKGLALLEPWKNLIQTLSLT